MAEVSSSLLEQLKSCIVWSWTYLWTLWFFLMLFLVYILRVPLKINDNLSTVSMFLNTLTPKFYVALTGTSSLISGLILIFEWWYFRKYGTSFIEQVSVSHLRPLLGGVDNTAPSNSTSNNGDTDSNRQSVSECKVWRNPLNLFRGAEYNRYTWVTGREPLTYYDMNLSAQDHQTFFTCETDHLRPADASKKDLMQKAWRERNPQARISAAHEALELNEIFYHWRPLLQPLQAKRRTQNGINFTMCATAYILLAEEEATTIVEAERLFKQALKAGEVCYRRSQQLQHHGAQYEAQHRRDTNVLVYIKRRLAMCSRKLGRTREAVKMMRDLMKEFPLLSMFNIHENLLEALLELQAYADVQAVLAKYDAFRMIPYPLEKGHLFYPYPICTETADRELLPLYPKKELPFFILFTAGLCSFTAMLALLTHQFPELMGVFAKAFLSTLFAPLNFVMEKVESILPSSLWHQLTRI
ncbi:suppressor of tumorigenicity 7 protein homolog isoform X13 [Carcharodon carcharias]|uniref:suppressor of tumorigenicity 7 protein homolog isoform X13 n=1 Tax=Carcharodon carcharias TaxID=13397 RepID=UPI001B7E1C52|nr:suppressor of tumorigenicity 7 protein homolog isoform X13 [Carcharodon carcharias]